MRKVLDRLFIGDQSDDAPDASFSVVRAAKHPWHFKKYGQLKQDHPNYFTGQDGDTLLVNIIDPAKPLFKRQVFEQTLAFMATEWKRGQSLLVTCNQGESRAPSLALLFAAKCLGAIESETYDLAWDAFELLVGRYNPGQGIQTYLREHWHEIHAERIPFIDGAAPKAQPQPVAAQIPVPQNPAESLALIRNSPYVHFYGFARIRDKDGVLTPADQHIVPNVFQSRACEAYEWCVANNQPIRLLLGPKPRQSGGSTISAQLCYHHTVRFKCSGMMLADENDRTDLIWNMFHRMADDDRVKGIWGMRHEWNTENSGFFYKDEDGVERELEWLRDTANDPKAGASGTRQVLWFSEAGRYSKEGKVTDTQVISNASSSVPEKPGTMIIMESTAEGEGGHFFNTWKGAVTLEQRMAGEVGNGWIKVFCAWHECPDYYLPRTPENEGWFDGALDEKERYGVEIYGWTAEQIAWRRKKIRGSFDGNDKLFCQEFPASETEAFQSSGSLRFSLEGITHLEKMALTGHQTAKFGVLEENKGLLTFLDRHEQPWLWVKEEPLYGCRYILSADCMTGEQSKGSEKTDEHAPLVWRAPYVDANGVFHGAKVVAAIHVRSGCRWDSDMLALRMHYLSKWYGNCIMAVEVNEALGVIRELIRLGANLWQRTKADEASGIPGATVKIPGWKTTPGAMGTRSMLVDALAKFIREKQGEVHFLPLIQQLKVFVLHADGSCAAKNGEHDDWVISAGIALTLMNAATTYYPPKPVTPTAHAPVSGGALNKGSAALG